MDNSWLDRNRNVIFIILSLAALGGVVIFYLRQPEPTPIEILPVETAPLTLARPTLLPSPTPTLAPLRVYVTGAVLDSDVYFLPPGSIIKNAIEAAGGFSPDADRERINQAQELKDQQHIHVPHLGEENPPPPVRDGLSPNEDSSGDRGGGPAIPLTGSPLNLNTATLEQLEALPGIGPALAQRIIDYREERGGFTTIEEIMQVSGIGQATFAKFKDLITVE